jgi:hypothetical protein
VQGHILGGIKKYIGRAITVDFGPMDRAWVEQNIIPFENTQYPAPFIWVWDIINHPTEVYLTRESKAALDHPIKGNLRDVKLDLLGIVEVDANGNVL